MIGFLYYYNNNGLQFNLCDNKNTQRFFNMSNLKFIFSKHAYVKRRKLYFKMYIFYRFQYQNRDIWQHSYTLLNIFSFINNSINDLIHRFMYNKIFAYPNFCSISCYICYITNLNLFKIFNIKVFIIIMHHSKINIHTRDRKLQWWSKKIQLRLKLNLMYFLR